MKKRGKIHQSIKRNPHSSSLNDLITHSQQTISSQASIYTNDSRYSRKNSNYFEKSSTQTQEFNDYEDIIIDEIDTLFITPEQQKKIQDILQFARKGKINAGNAFEIPVRVIDPQLTESANMRFWKFSSELLSASMNIYDKRVQNVFQNTNKMFDNLVRVQGKNQPFTQEQLQQKEKKQRTQLVQMQVGDIGKTEAISSYQIGTVNCQQPEKINIKNLNSQFKVDPLFHKRLQAFDSNTFKSLFMNVFEFRQNYQIEFFNQNQAKLEDLKMDIEEKIQQKMEQSMEQYEQKVPKFIGIQFDKIRQTKTQVEIFNFLGNFKKQNVRQSLQNVKFQVKDFSQEFLLNSDFEGKNKLLQFQNNNQEDQTHSMQSFQEQNNFHFQFNASNHTQISQDGTLGAQSMPYTYSSQSQSQSQYNFLNDDIQQSYSQMTPWQLEFKGLKLQKKRGKRGEKKKIEKAPEKIYQIDFLDKKRQLRAKIFQAKLSRNNFQKNNQIEEKNILPISMNPFVEAYKRKRDYNNFTKQTRQFLTAKKQNSFENNNNNNNQIAQNLLNREYQQNTNFQAYQQTMTQKATNFQSNLFEFQHNTQGQVYKAIGIRNLREIKEKIFSRIEQKGSIKLSQLNININPSSVLVIFLHLVNQNNIEIIQVDGEYDIQIFKTQ